MPPCPADTTEDALSGMTDVLRRARELPFPAPTAKTAGIRRAIAKKLMNWWVSWYNLPIPAAAVTSLPAIK